jgi:hypothetical protein
VYTFLELTKLAKNGLLNINTTITSVEMIILYSQHVHAYGSKTMVYSSAIACPPARMQRLACEIIQSKIFWISCCSFAAATCHPYRYCEHESLSVQRCRRMIRRYSLQ